MLMVIGLIGEKFIHISRDKKAEDEKGQDPGKVWTQENGKFHAHALIGFRYEIFPTPAAPVATEEEKKEPAQGKDIIADQKIFKIKDA